MNAEQTQRARFEAWVSSPPLGYDINRWPADPPPFAISGNYADNKTQRAWEIWQEASKRWLPISTAPKDSTVIDIWSRQRGRLVNYVRLENSYGQVYYGPVEYGVTVVRDATHWMSIPEAPEDEPISK